MKKKVIIIENDLEFANLQSKIINLLENFQNDKIYDDPYLFLKDDSNEIDIILLDIVFPNTVGLDFISEIKKNHPNAAIVINSTNDDPETIAKTLQKGVLGYIEKQNFLKYIKEVLESVSNNGAFFSPKITLKVIGVFQKNTSSSLNILTKKEMEVAELIVKGLSYKSIAKTMSISLDTVRMHIRNIYKKLEINSKIELINLYKPYF